MMGKQYKLENITQILTKAQRVGNRNKGYGGEDITASLFPLTSCGGPALLKKKKKNIYIRAPVYIF